MANRYLLTDAAGFAALNQIMNAAFSYPNQYASAYAAPLQHNDGGDAVYFTVEPRCLPHLTPEQLGALLPNLPAGWVKKIPNNELSAAITHESADSSTVFTVRNSYVEEIAVQVTAAFDAGVTITVAGTEIAVDLAAEPTIIVKQEYTAAPQNISAVFSAVARTQGSLTITLRGRLIR